jgi:ectoine hydroxylase-related dioxygenase (phytanoyl-CoA dioxygenase family)
MELCRIAASDPVARDAVGPAIDRDGAVVIDGVLDESRCAACIAEIDRVERALGTAEGTNDFEGFETRRVFNVMAYSETIRQLIIDPVVLGVTESLLDAGLLLSGTTSMNIGPRETPQLLHSDDGMVTLARPHPATMITTLWALSPFTADNGATRLVPGSHRWAARGAKPGDDVPDAISAAMPAGSVLVLHASTWHGGGANNTARERRYGLSIQYVAGWCRQQQNLMLGLDRALVATFPPRLQELIGYSLYQDVMGHVERRHPSVLLGVDRGGVGGWDHLEGPRAARQDVG